MNSKLIRTSYYEEDHPLNEQEYKELSLVQVDPYWKVRGLCYSLNMNCFGEKDALLKRIELELYNNYLYKKQSTAKLLEVCDTDIELLVRNLRCSTGKFNNISLRDLELYSRQESTHGTPETRVTEHQWPWQVVIELARTHRPLSYLDVYRGITPLMRSSMIFYNHFLEGECITAGVVLPFTPKVLEYLTPLQIYSLVKALGMKTHYDVPNVMDIFKQKLLDLFYCVDDSPRLHGFLPCQSRYKPCHNLASTFCANFMCKLCCQDIQHKLPCVCHDRYEQFFRYKVRSVYMFEESKNFDRSRTLRLQMRRLARRLDLERAFENVPIQWDKIAFYHHYAAHRMQIAYLVLDSQDDARKVLQNQEFFTNKLQKFDVTLSALSTSLYRVCERYKDAESMLAIIRPLSSLEVVTEISSDGFFRNQLGQLMQSITQISASQFFIEEDINPVTGERDNYQIFVRVPNREAMERIYNAQPLFGSLIVHKLSHIQVCPFLRYTLDSCLMCVAKKEPRCIHDMCRDCCSRQKYGILVCQCSLQVVQSNLSAKKELAAKDKSMSESLCEKCPNRKDKDCPNKMCSICCPIQAIRFDCAFHDESCYSRDLKSMTSQMLGRKILALVSELHLKFRHELKNGRYDWFRPLHGSDVGEAMRKANRELQELQDSGANIRGTQNQRYKRDGKILSFQGTESVTIWMTPSEKIYEHIDTKGHPFVEYYYTEEACYEERCVWVKNSLNKYRTYSLEDYENYINAPNLRIIKDFHVLLLGLDRKVFSIKELYNELFQSIKSMVGSIDQQNILIIDNDSLLMEVYNSATYRGVKNLDENIGKMGRAACIKLDNVLDALALVTREVRLTLPLFNRKNDEPLVYPSNYLIRFIEEYTANPQGTQLNYLTAGSCFAPMNKEMESINGSMKSLMSGGGRGGGGGDSGRPGRGGGGGRGRGGGRGGRGKRRGGRH
eukprot:TRINITY_DN5459_c0_g4_i1.p1 TRINITY_DN5459_c0_g4~~TRINITY_DN5459_c0_g4_i1.p1  ORF type:complete len:950 (-),score=187.80 TRINITY_DN5459_c0_g4_i1:961-3810(-)